MPKPEHRLLTDDEVSSGLQTLPSWNRVGEQIQTERSFKTYKDGVVFAAAVAYLADCLDHHPDITIRYAKVTITVSTHSVNGLSPFDLELARRIDALA